MRVDIKVVTFSKSPICFPNTLIGDAILCISCIIRELLVLVLLTLSQDIHFFSGSVDAVFFL